MLIYTKFVLLSNQQICACNLTFAIYANMVIFDEFTTVILIYIYTSFFETISLPFQSKTLTNHILSITNCGSFTKLLKTSQRVHTHRNKKKYRLFTNWKAIFADPAGWVSWPWINKNKDALHVILKQNCLFDAKNPNKTHAAT